MPHLIVHHQVQDYATWEPKFLAHGDARREAGIKSHQLFRAVQDPNHVSMVFEVESLEKVGAMMGNPEFKQVMQDAGVIGEPTVHVLQAAGQPFAY